MPQIRSKQSDSSIGANIEIEYELMRNIAFIMKEYSVGYFEVMKLPYAIFLSLLKWGQVFIIEQTPEGRDALYKESAIFQTEPDLGRLRQLDGYQAKEVD